jgi:hypothetical protein
MGKKSRAKQQRQKSAQHTPQPQTAYTAVPTATLLGNKLATPGSNRPVVQADYMYVRTDIRRILTILVILVALLLAAFITQTRSTLFERAGDRVVRFLQLQ